MPLGGGNDVAGSNCTAWCLTLSLLFLVPDPQEALITCVQVEF